MSNDKRWQGCGEKERILVYCRWECKLLQALWKTAWRLLKKLVIELPYNPAILLLGVYPKEVKITISKRYQHSHIHGKVVYHSQDSKPTSVSIDRCKEKENVTIHVCMCVYTHRDTHIHKHIQTDTYKHNGI